MGLEIKEKDGKYQIKSTICDEILHDEKYISLEEAKAVLIESRLWSVVEPIIEIDKDFPEGYQINGMRIKRTKEKEYKENTWNDFLEVIHKHNIVLDNYYNKEVLNNIAEIKNNLSILFNLAMMIHAYKSKEIILSEAKQSMMSINESIEKIKNLLNK